MNKDVLALQRRLAGLNLSPGPRDGLWGPQTARAVNRALDTALESANTSPTPPVSEKSIQTSDIADPVWLAKARSYIGQKEVPGSGNNPAIVRWWEAMKAPFRDDLTPWCGAYIGGVLAESGLTVQSDGAAARAWLKYGVALDKPAVGCIVVFWRGSRNGWSGHVGFVVGKDRSRNLMVLGGNQSDAVNIKPFSKDRVLGYRWPGTWPFAERFNLPVLNSDGKVSTNEA